jgi:hypothetical protein
MNEIENILGDSPFAQPVPARTITSVDADHPSHKAEIEMMTILRGKLTPWITMSDPMDPALSCRELAETAAKGLDGVLDKFRGAEGFPDIHLPMNWPKAAQASIKLARRTLIVLEDTTVEP